MPTSAIPSGGLDAAGRFAAADRWVFPLARRVAADGRIAAGVSCAVTLDFLAARRIGELAPDARGDGFLAAREARAPGPGLGAESGLAECDGAVGGRLAAARRALRR